MRKAPFILLFLFAAMAWRGYAIAQSGGARLSPIQNIQFTHSTWQQGIQGIAIAFEINIDGLALPDSSKLAAIAWLEDDRQQALLAAPDAKASQGMGGIFRDSIGLDLRAGTGGILRKTAFIPYHALSLAPGRHERFLRIRIIQRGTGTEVGSAPARPFFIQMPTRRMYRITMQDLEAYETDISGETWDYVLLSPREIYPELEWILFRGGKELFRSERVRNSLHHIVGPGKNSCNYFSLADGDSLTLKVEDFDLLSSSDPIGSMAFAPHAVRGKKEGAFQRVKHFALGIEESILPQLVPINWKAAPNQRHEGVSGLMLQFQYEVEQYPGDAMMQLSLEAPHGGLLEQVRHGKMIEGPALFRSEGMLELHAPRGSLRFFVPWYGLPPDAEMLRFGVEMQLPDGNRYPVGRFGMGWQLSPPVIEDFEFGQQAIFADSLNGLGGFRISAVYKLANAYFRDLPKSQIQLRTSIIGPAGPVDTEAMQVLGNNGKWSAHPGTLIISSASDTLEFFLPYFVLGNSGLKPIRIGHSALLKEAQTENIIGRTANEIEVEIPEIRTYEFQVRDLVGKRELFPEAGMGIWWRVQVGGRTYYASRVEWATTHAQWKNNENMRLYLCEQDAFTLEIMRRNKLGKDERIAQWTGKVSDLPEGVGKTAVLKLAPLKKLSYRISREQ